MEFLSLDSVITLLTKKPPIIATSAAVAEIIVEIRLVKSISDHSFNIYLLVPP